MRRREWEDAVRTGNGAENFIEWIQEKGWSILNGATEGDWEREFTYIGPRGSTVIDYVWLMIGCVKMLINFKVRERVDSADHMPLCLEFEGTGKAEEEEHPEEEGEEKETEAEIIVWDREAIESFNKATEEGEGGEEIQVTVEGRWQEIKNIVNSAMVKRKVRRRKKGVGYRDWWDRNCTRKKKEVKRMHKRWKSGKVEREEYMLEKVRYKEFLQEKIKEKREEKEEELKRLKKEADVWKYIREEIKERREEGEREREEPQEGFSLREEGSSCTKEEDLEREEIGRAIGRMKKKKAAGIDGIPMEAWLYAGSFLREKVIRLIQQVWKEGEMPEEWRRSIIVPLYKKGDQEKMESYRGILLLCTAYKVYAEIIRNRLEKAVERRSLLSEGQAGFRKGRSTIDNIFVLSHMAQREISEGGDGKKGDVMENNEKKWLGREDDKKSKKMYEVTEITVRTRYGTTENFYTKKGVKQGCGVGGVKIGEERIWSLMYADDVVLVANNREALQDMMGTFKRCLRDRKLELSAEKIKVLVFNRKGKKRKEVWKWGNKEIEEVNKFKYLGFTFNRKGNYKEHIKELSRKGRLAANKVWGLGERLGRNDFRRRWTLLGGSR
ncbi:golgin subfamily A member 6-like protein 1 [Solenopsis invicta]|uniref:golgin subfamily A member 6-like protein 1 n=1 Tax=Solenopsis invicta TaxID=13686 RepID=UPI00193E1068|nr:golgin subfamily A member 6-like protein 1 [Solenopsis invicta]